MIVEGRCLRSFGRRHGDLAKGAHGSTTNHLLLETIRREREELSLLRSKGRIGDSVHASQYYSAFDGITNPIIPLAPGYKPSQAYTGHSGAFQDSTGTPIPALNPNAFTIPFVNPGQNGVPDCGLSTAGFPVCDVFETTFGGAGQRNIFRQAFQKRADVSVVKLFQLDDRLAVQYRLDLFNVSNTPSFDIPNNAISTAFAANPQIVYNPTSSVIANRQNVYHIQNNGTNVSSASNLGVVQQTIGSPRLIQMSLRINF